MLGREMELTKLHSTIASLNQELEALRERINTQELSPDDVKVCMCQRPRYILTTPTHHSLPNIASDTDGLANTLSEL